MSFNLKDYETVASRVLRFQAKFPNGVIQSRVISHDQEAGLVYCEAKVYRDIADPMPAAIDGAYGIMKSFPQNMQKFYVEDTLSSATGRALSLILEVIHKPTREDMSRVDSIQAMQATAAQPMKVENASDPWTIKEVQQAEHVSTAIQDLDDTITATSLKEIPLCKCGEMMKWSEGARKSDGKPWGKYACATWTKSAGSRCDAIHWYELASDGTWKAQKKWSN